MKELHSKDKGSLGELSIAADLVSQGFSVFRELGDNSKIDLIAVDSNYKLYKIQIKAITSKNGKIEIYTKKSGPNYQFKYQEYHFDVCAVFVLDLHKIMYISSKELLKNKTAFTIRLPDFGSNQHIKAHLYEDYLSFYKAIGN